MPEQLTKHPEVTLQVLRSAGAQCGTGAEQAILKTCPAERFCKLPGGEVCIYGLNDAARMTQITPGDWQLLTPPAVAADGGTRVVAPPDPADAAVAALGPGLAGLVIGALLAGLWLRRR